VTDDVM